jgi:hypothetical protein
MEFAERLRGELSGLLDVIHRAGGGVVFEELPGALEEDTRSAEADGESSAARRALIEEANRVAEALKRLRHEEDGIAPREIGDGSRQKRAGATARPGPSSLLTRPL